MKCPNCNSNNSPDTHFCKKCGFPLDPSKNKSNSQTKTLSYQTMQLKKGSIFANRYEVIDEIGQGGMGRVYRVFDKKIEEDIALKLIRMEIATNSHAIERFRNELKIARKISHKNVCRMFDLNEYSGIHYITMEYVEGEDLNSLINRTEKISPIKSIDIGIQICKGLIEAHEIGTIHRDLKPKNIMIDKEGNAHIMDFGIAHSTETDGVTEVGKTVGTPRYMSPEQISGQELDQRSDIYSLGIMMYELLTGQTPFEGDNFVNIKKKKKTEIPKSPIEVESKIPKKLNDVILKCLKKDREKRYQSTKELLSELININKEISLKKIIHRDKQKERSSLIVFLKNRKKLAIFTLMLAVLIISVLALFTMKNTGLFNKNNSYITNIKELIEINDFTAAFQMAKEAEEISPEDSRLRKIWPIISKEISIHTNPEGAEIFYKDVLKDQEEWHYIGTTPIEKVKIPKGNLLWKSEKNGYKTIPMELEPKKDILNWDLTRAKRLFKIKDILKSNKIIKINGGTEENLEKGMTGKIFSKITNEQINSEAQIVGSFILTDINEMEATAEIIDQKANIDKDCPIRFDTQPKVLLSISCNQKNAQVHINDVYKGLTDLKLLLEPQVYNLKISKQNYIRYTKEIELFPYQNSNLNVFLKPTSQSSSGLNVTTTPDGAEVIFGDSQTPVGKTPFKKKLDPGNYTIKLHLADYKEEIYSFEIKSGEKINRHFNLKPQIGTLVIESEPSGADVYIDDESEPAGITPFKINLPPKKYNIRLAQEGLEEQQHEVSIKIGETISKHYKLNKKSDSAYLLVINTVPPDANVYINNEKQNKKTPLNIKLDIPRVKLKIEKENFKPYESIVDLDEPVEIIDQRLEKLEMAKLIISSYRQASINLDGESVDTTVPPELKINVYEGLHTIRFVFDENLFIDRTAELKGGETKRIHCDEEVYNNLIKENVRYEFGAWPKAEVRIDENHLRDSIPPIRTKWMDAGIHKISYKFENSLEIIINDMVDKGIKKKFHVSYEEQDIQDLGNFNLIQEKIGYLKEFIIIESNQSIDISIDNKLKHKVTRNNRVTFPIEDKNISQIGLAINQNNVDSKTEINIIKTKEKRLFKFDVKINIIK